MRVMKNEENERNEELFLVSNEILSDFESFFVQLKSEMNFRKKKKHKKKHLISVTNNNNDQQPPKKRKTRNSNKQKATKINGRLLGKLIAFGPRMIGSNLLFINDQSFMDSNPLCSLFSEFNEIKKQLINGDIYQYANNIQSKNSMNEMILQATKNAFQSICLKGPLCNEPLLGVAFVITEIRVNSNANNNQSSVLMDFEDIVQSNKSYCQQIVSLAKELCVDAFLTQSPRIVQPMYKCFIQGSADVLGSIYEVIGKRKGQLTGESIVEGTNLYDIYSLLPVLESFGFSDHLRKETAGNVVPQLTFSHWQIIDDDPLWIPMTMLEIEEYGENVNNYIQIHSKNIVDQVRKRKGLAIEEKIVQFAEKQSNLSRKK